MQQLLSLLTALLCAIALVVQTAQAQVQDEKNEDVMHAENSRKLYEAFHCQQPSLEAMKAFSGCWGVVSAWAPPKEDYLKLGMRMSAKEAHIIIRSHSTRHHVHSDAPRYCMVDNHPTVMPYPDTDFSKYYTNVYSLQDLSQVSAQRIARYFYELISSHHKLSEQELAQIINDFVGKGGRLIQAWTVMSPTNLYWDNDSEEDFWALPSSCEGWDRVEELWPGDKMEGP